MVAQFDRDRDGSYPGKLRERRERALNLERQREIQREFLLEQVDELAADFVDHPEQIGNYIADLEAAGMLGVADRGMLFSRLWETMGPAFADRAFRMSERAVDASDVELARDIAADAEPKRGLFAPAKAGVQADRGVAPDERRDLDQASRLLGALAKALGLDLDIGPTPAASVAQQAPQDDRISDEDPERAAKTRELLDVLGPQLGVDQRAVEVKVDEQARYETESQRIYGLMSDGTVFLNPEIYDPETPQGRGLLAHEVAHIAQRENTLRGAAHVEPSIVAAEREAHGIMHQFAQGGTVQAPLASLDRYDKAACEPQAEPDKEGSTTVDKIPPVYEIVEDKIQVPTIHFPFDEPGRAIQGKDAIDAPDYAAANQRALRGLIETIAAYPEITGIRIESHTDSRGKNDYNLALSERRAAATLEWLKAPSDGNSPLTISNVASVGKVEEEPLIEGNDLTEAQHTQNRRSEFVITEVNGQAHSGPFKPKKRRMVEPGKTIITHLDADGNVIEQEVIPDGEQPEAAASADPQQTSSAATSGGQQPLQSSSASAAPSAGGSSAAKPTTGGKRKARGERVQYRWAGPALRSVDQPRLGEREGLMQLKAAPGGVRSAAVGAMTRAQGAGEAIPGGVRERFESAFGHDFGDIRIHRGSSQAMAVGATAFARGNDIHFAPGRFDAGSQSGLDVLGHELTHIVQQRAGRVPIPQGKGTTINVDRALEAEADLLGARAARGQRVNVTGSSAGLIRRPDAIQFEGARAEAPGGAEEPAAEAPNQVELYLAGQKISARMPEGASPGQVRVDFAQIEVLGVNIGAAQVRFNDDWEITGGTVEAGVSIGSFVQAENITLQIEQREVRGKKQGHIEAQISGAQLKISDLFDTTIDLTVGSGGVQGTATIEASAPITVGGGITLDSGSIVVSVDSSSEEGPVSVSGEVVGTIEGVGRVTLTANAISDGHLRAGITLALDQPLTLVEGVTLQTVGISGEYVHGQSWSVTGSVTVNVRDWIGADIDVTYNHSEAEGATRWDFRGTLRQLQPYTIGEEGGEQLTLSNGELTVDFQSGAFVSVEAIVDYETTNWHGRVTADYDVQNQQLSGSGTIDLRVPELPLGASGGRLTAASAALTLTENRLDTLSGSATAIFPYEDEDTFEIVGDNLTLTFAELLVTGEATVTTLRQLDFGDKAAYNASVNQGATATLSVADNQLLGISGGLEFVVKHAEEQVGVGTIDVTFSGDTNALNATATFTLSSAFGVPDREAGPVMLQPEGTFVLSVEGSQLAVAEMRGVGYEISQVGEGATGVFAGTINGTYDFRSGMLNGAGDGALKGDWPLTPADGVTLVFKEGGHITAVVSESTLTSVDGAFPYEATIAAQGKVPQLALQGELKGSYNGDTKMFGGELTGELTQPVDVPMGEAGGDLLKILTGAKAKATVDNNAPGALEVSFDAEYYRAGDKFLSGQVANASYDFRTGDFGLNAELTLEKDVAKSTENGKWTFVVKNGSKVGVEVEASALKALTGRLPFEVHDTEGCLLKGNLTDARLDVDKLEFTGGLDLALGRDIEYPRSDDGGQAAAEGSPPVSAVAKKDVSRVFGRIDKNTFTEVGGELQFDVKVGGVKYGEGNLGATWDLEQMKLSGGGALTLTQDFILGGTEARTSSDDPVTSWALVFVAGSQLDFSIANNLLDTANINLNASFQRNGEVMARGSVVGQYKLGSTETFVGEATVTVVKAIELAAGDRFAYHLWQGSDLNVSMTGTDLNHINGSLVLMATEGGQEAVELKVTADYTPGSGVTADGTIGVKKDILIKEAGTSGYSLWLSQESNGTCSVKQSELQEVGGTLTLRVKKNEEDFARGEFTASYKVSEGTGSEMSAEGRLTLEGRAEITPEGSAVKVALTGGHVGGKIDKGELASIDGEVQGEIAYAEASPLATFSLNGRYTTQPADFTASGTLTTVNRLRIVAFEGYTLFLGVGASIEGSVTAFELDTLTANIPLELDKPEGSQVVKATLSGTYTHADKNFNGSGNATVVAPITVAENVGDKGYSFYVGPSAAHAIIENNGLKEVGGTLTVFVCDSADPGAHFLKATAQATYTSAEGGKVTASGNLEVTRRKKMLDTAAGYAAILDTGTGAQVAVTDNQLDSISGTVNVAIEKPEGTPFAKISLGGEYTEATGFKGTGEAELQAEVEIVSVNIGSDPYTLFAMPGTGASITLDNSDVTTISGQVIAMIRDGANDFIEVTATGVNYDFPGKVFSGAGSATVLMDKQLATFGQDGETLWLLPGSGATASVIDNQLQQVGGNIQLRLDDNEGEYVQVALQGSFDAAGGSGFSGAGNVTVTRLKRLASIGDYSFWLAPGAGAGGIIDQNELTEVNGNVPFEVHDAEGILLEGQAQGAYTTKDKKFSGSGGVYLGRDVEYEIGDIKLVFKRGSGGDGTVEDNELRTLGGTLNVDIHDGQGPMVNVNAAGEFDAVDKKIKWVEGSASLLRPIDVGGEGDNAILSITTLDGSARVENNELKFIRGKLGFRAPRLLDMEGWVEGGWEATGGQDVFYGTGKVNFTLFEEPAKHRWMKGEADFTYNRDETWNIGGEVDYQLNEMIGGKVRVDVDQTLDPVIGGELRVENVTLVEGRDLFKWNKDFPLIRTTIAAGPVPIDLGGGVGVGIALSMLPLTFGTTIAFQGWRPLSAATKVPDFQARADLNTGLKLAAALKPWFSVGVGVTGASAGLRLQGEVGLNVDVNVNPYAELEGKDGEYFGKLGVGVGVVGSGSLGLTPQLYATLGKTWTYDLTNLTHDLGQLFSVDFDFAFPFGDNPGAPEQGSGQKETTPAPATTQQISGHEEQPAMPAEVQGAANKPGPVAGGPDLNEANNESEQEGEREGPMAELMQKIDSISEWGAKIGALAKVAGELVTMLTFMATIPPPFGLAVAGAYLAYKLISGGLTFEEIGLAFRTLWEIIGMIGDSVKELLPDWLTNLWDKIQGKTWDQLLGDLIDNMANWLSDRFPSASGIIRALADMAKDVLTTIANVIRNIISGNFSLDDFLDICKALGGSIATLVLEMVGEAVVDAVGDAADAVVDFITDPPW
ncbi:MAG: hypothetical protein CSA66_04690 [Proteobacteria bacterium]|nr:MAG: hypothetical protein CSA66_04690 [Pseudomonadota bacterium]